MDGAGVIWMGRMRQLLVVLACTALASSANARAPRQAIAMPDSRSFMEATPQFLAEMRALVDARARAVADRLGPRMAVVAAWVEATSAGEERRADVDALLRSATDSGAGDAMVWWMLLDACGSLHEWCGSYRAHARTRLTELEPDNAAVWLRLIRSHDGESDAVVRRYYLTRAAQSKRYEDHERDWARVLREFYAGIKIPEAHATAYTLGTGTEVARYTHILGMASVVAGAAASSGEQCGEDGRPIGSAAVAAECRAVFGLMATSTNPLTRRIALEHALELADQPDDRRFRALQLLRLLWVDAHWGELRLGIDDDTKIVAVFDDRIRDGEVASREHILTRAGVDPAPPPDWDPPQLSPHLHELLRDAGVIAETAPAAR